MVKGAADVHRTVKDATDPSDSGGSASYTAFVRSESCRPVSCSSDLMVTIATTLRFTINPHATSDLRVA